MRSRSTSLPPTRRTSCWPLPEAQGELAAAAERRFHGQEAFVQCHDLSRHAQADAATAALGREERQKDVVQVCRIDAGTVVDHLNQHLALIVARSAQHDAAVAAGDCSLRYCTADIRVRLPVER